MVRKSDQMRGESLATVGSSKGTSPDEQVSKKSRMDSEHYDTLRLPKLGQTTLDRSVHPIDHVLNSTAVHCPTGGTASAIVSRNEVFPVPRAMSATVESGAYHVLASLARMNDSRTDQCGLPLQYMRRTATHEQQEGQAAQLQELGSLEQLQPPYAQHYALPGLNAYASVASGRLADFDSCAGHISAHSGHPDEQNTVFPVLPHATGPASIVSSGIEQHHWANCNAAESDFISVNDTDQQP